MKWQVIQSSNVDAGATQSETSHSWSEAYFGFGNFLRLSQIQDYKEIRTLIVAAIAQAEELMECSLLTRTIQATYYAHDRMYLPRGPVQNIVNVTVNGVTQDPNTYSLESFGHSDLLRYNNSTHQPFATPVTLVCTYTAGYGILPDIPPDILQTIRCHVGLLYENRELATDKVITRVPFISEFYKLRGRGTGVG